MNETSEYTMRGSATGGASPENTIADSTDAVNKKADVAAEDVVPFHSEFSDKSESKKVVSSSAAESVNERSESDRGVTAEKQAPATESCQVENSDESAVQTAIRPDNESTKDQKSNVQTNHVKALSNEQVIGHTATLWKYLPIPEEEPEPFPEYINGTIQFQGSKVVAARVRGKKHKHEGTNCDDWYEVANYEGMTFVAVSDGAGSKKFSRIGARESCKAAIGYLVSAFEDLFTGKPEVKTNLTLELSDSRCMESCGILAGIVQQSVIQAHDSVEAAFYSRITNPEYEKVLGRGLQMKDLSGTLLIVVLIPINKSTKEHLVISCQIGDGMIVIINSKGNYSKSMKLMGVPDSGDFSGETDFLTSAQMKNIETLQHRTKISRSIVDTVMVMSDGVADDYFPNETQMRRLYFDLILNGILEKPINTVSLASLSQEQIRLFKHIPDPLAYPWVNDQTIKIPVQYTNRILASTGLTLEDVWNDPTVLSLARLELEGNNNITDLSEKLKIWLDNYVERGSFDDRTLVVVTM